MNIQKIYLTKKAEILKAAIDNYHNTVRKQHDFVNALIISGANQDFKCADSDVADYAIHVTNEFNEHVDLPNMYFTGVMFTEDMRLEYAFDMFVEEQDGCIAFMYSEGNLRPVSSFNWGFKLADVTESWLQEDLNIVAGKLNQPIEEAIKTQKELLELEIKTHCKQVMQEILQATGSASSVVNQFVCIPDERGNCDDMLDLYFIRESIEEKLKTAKLTFELGGVSLSSEGTLQYWLLIDVGDSGEVDRIGRADVRCVDGIVKIDWEYIDEQLVVEVCCNE